MKTVIWTFIITGMLMLMILALRNDGRQTPDPAVDLDPGGVERAEIAAQACMENEVASALGYSEGRQAWNTGAVPEYIRDKAMAKCAKQLDSAVAARKAQENDK
jgi:hypothetical protein